LDSYKKPLMSSLSGNLQRLNWKCGHRIEHLDSVDISAFLSIGTTEQQILH